jgi:hypothetical protein
MTRCALLLGLAASLACTGAPRPDGPVPLAVTPAQSAALEPVPVEIAGRDFEAWVRTDFAGGSAGSVSAAFAARLEPAAGGDAVALQDVTLTAQRTLRATVPAGLPRGLYGLVVTDPRGRSGTLEQAFRVVTAAESVAAFRIDVLGPARAGIGFATAFTAVDAQGLVVDGFTGSVSLSDSSGTVTPASVGPFVLGRLQAQVTVTALAAADRLTASDALGHSGTSDPFDVVAGPPVALAFATPPVTAAAGACSPRLEVELRDGLDHPATAEAAVTALLQSSPPGLAFFADAACASGLASLAIAPGASRAGFHFRAAGAGAVAIRVVPHPLPSATQDETVTP